MVDPLINGRSTPILRDLLATRDTMGNLERQLSSGKKADTYGGLGTERSIAVAMRQDLAQLEGYQSNIVLADLRLSISGQVMTRMSGIAQDGRAALDPNIYQLLGDGSTQGQRTAYNLLGEALTILNSKAGERYVFSGGSVDTQPVASINAILDGDGTRAGYKQVRDERLQADQGTGQLGRLALTNPLPNQLQVAEDGVHGFGLKLASAATDLTNATLTGPAGTPAQILLDLAGQPLDGETLDLSFTLPDGSAASLTLTAEAVASGDPGTFEIGATATDTLANLQTALTAALPDITDGALRTASAKLAADNFFDMANGGAPQRVAGPPFATATALQAGTPVDTVFWYSGENGTDPARGSVTARIDENLTIAYGARANEEAFTVLVKNLALFTSETFNTQADAEQSRYTALASHTLAAISYPDGTQTLQGVAGELGAAQAAAGRADERHTLKTGLLQTVVDDIEAADLNEVSVGLLSLRTQLEASYRATSIMFEMSLVNYI